MTTHRKGSCVLQSLLLLQLVSLLIQLHGLPRVAKDLLRKARICRKNEAQDHWI